MRHDAGRERLSRLQGDQGSRLQGYGCPPKIVLLTGRRVDDEPEREAMFLQFSQADAMLYKPCASPLRSLRPLHEYSRNSPGIAEAQSARRLAHVSNSSASCSNESITNSNGWRCETS